MLPLSHFVPPWLAGDNYVPRSSPLRAIAEAQFATQIKREAFEEQGEQGEGENNREQQREGQRHTTADRTDLHRDKEIPFYIY